VAHRFAPDALALRGALRSESGRDRWGKRRRKNASVSWGGGGLASHARAMRPFARMDPFAPRARCGSCESKSATHLWTRVVRLGVPRVGPAFPAVRCVEPGFAHETLSREIHVSAPKRAAADVTRPRGPLPRTARLIGTSRRDRRGRLRRGGPHRRTTAQPGLPTWIFMSSIP
jgi:hypothetical protein